MNDIKHSILIITYNQQHLLAQALNSLLIQSVAPYEIIISDDASTDQTWNVVMHYYNRFPAIIKPFRNEKNLGIFGNFNKIKNLPTGDIISLLAGDDYYKLGIFEAFNKEVKKYNIDPQKEKFILISNAIDLHVDGTEVIYNNYKFRNQNLFKLKIRYGLNFRDTGFSAAMWKNISPIREDLGYLADWLYCIDQIEKSEHFYFINKAFPVYRIGSGITAKEKIESLIKSKLSVVLYIIEKYDYKLDSSDKLFLKKEVAYNKYILNSTFYGFFVTAYYLLANWNNYPFYRTWYLEMKTFLLITGSKILKLLKLKQSK